MDEVVTIIGSGPAGLSCAAEVLRHGVPATVLEKGDSTAAAWAGRYDSLRFNTSRIHSAFPGEPFAKEWGQFPTRDQYVGYLHDYAERHQVPVRTGIEVTRIERSRDDWLLRTGSGDLRTRQVVVAIGRYNRPLLPEWARSTDFPGQVLHSAGYRSPAPFAGRQVVVVGAGSTGLEIAHELARSGAASVRLSFRTPPNILLRVMGGLPADLPVPLFLHLPTAMVDRMLAAMQRRFVGDLSPYGLPRPTEGVLAGIKRRGVGTAVVDREVIDGIRDGLFDIVPAVDRLEAGGVRLIDERLLPADTVIAATGFGTGLPELVGEIGVLDEYGVPLDGTGAELAPGLRFFGYVARPGLTGYVGKLARRVGREIAAREKASRPAPDDWTRPVSRTPSSHDHATFPD